MRLYTLLFLGITLLFSCEKSTSSKLNNDCSSIEEDGEYLVLNNYYFQSLSNNTVLATHSFQKMGDSLAIPLYKMYPVFPKEDSAAWNIEFKANKYLIQKNLLIAEIEQNNHDATYALFNLDKGVKLLDYTYDKFEILFLDETEKRFLGFYSRNAALKEESNFSFDDQTLGFFSYASVHGEIQNVKINLIESLVPDSFDISNPVVELKAIEGNAIELNSGKTLYFSGSNGKQSAVVAFDIFLTFYSLNNYTPFTFQLQVRNDQMQLVENNSESVFQIVAL